MDKQLLMRRMIRSKFFLIGIILAIFLVFLSTIGPYISPFDPTANSLVERLMKPEGFKNGWSGHVLGTDELGRDVFSRLLSGAGASFKIAAIVVIFQIIIGFVLGILAGYFGGIVDTIIMRLCDIMLALPSMLVAIAVISVLGPNTFNLVVTFALTGWVNFCRVARNDVIVLRNQEFVQASRALGAKNTHIMFTQILPNVTTPIIIMASQRFGFIIIQESTLSFLNMGIQQPLASWGNMIAGGRAYVATCPWLIFAPGIALMITVLAFNFLGDGLRDVLDPKKL